MERYFKIAESRLIELLESEIRLSTLNCAGVDNWDDGGMCREIFEDMCKEMGLKEPEEGYWYGYDYEDLAKHDLKYFQEVND